MQLLFTDTIDMVTMMIEVTETNITEPDVRDTTTIDICFRAAINQTLSRDANFKWVINADQSSATYDIDYSYTLPSSEIVTLQSGTNSSYSFCFNGSVFGDNLIEGNEMAIATLTPLSEKDTVEYPGCLDSLILTIIDTSST